MKRGSIGQPLPALGDHTSAEVHRAILAPALWAFLSIARLSSSAAPTAADAESETTHIIGVGQVRYAGGGPRSCSRFRTADLFRETRRSPAEREVPQRRKGLS